MRVCEINEAMKLTFSNDQRATEATNLTLSTVQRMVNLSARRTDTTTRQSTVPQRMTQMKRDMALDILTPQLITRYHL